MILSKKQAQNPPINGAVDSITKSNSSIVSDPVFKTLFLDLIQLKYPYYKYQFTLKYCSQNFTLVVQDR